jgi:hypothetical protein
MTDAEPEGTIDTMAEPYSAPQVREYGGMGDITAAVGFTGPEDGASKLVIHHESSTLRLAN